MPTAPTISPDTFFTALETVISILLVSTAETYGAVIIDWSGFSKAREYHGLSLGSNLLDFIPSGHLVYPPHLVPRYTYVACVWVVP
ncbi:hypothetical protein SDC9_161051 [bioreactor metagenome]|uniref:Uncharacterized protein n=1 Tax=bioreactor metagenome TaxID=1076179 RepID=A0A645FHB5_9ZZZZ